MASEPQPFTFFGARRLPLAVPIGLALAILGGTIFLASLYVRSRSQKQITGQHAQILYALWLREKFGEEHSDFLGSAERISDQLPAVLQTARLRQLVDFLGMRLFDAQGRFELADPNVSEAPLDPELLVELRQLKPVARLRKTADLSEVSVVVAPDAPVTGPLLEVCIPLHPSEPRRLVGVAQFILDGAAVAEEFRRLDRHLILQGSATLLVGGVLLTLVLGASFQQFDRLNRLLAQRTEGLLRANQELALAAKTSAVGAVTAHLIHGLKNPLSGLQSFVASRGSGGASEAKDEWELAVSSTRRMQMMIGEIVRVLRDEDSASQYELSLEEFLSLVSSKVRPLAVEAGVRFATELSAEGTLHNREANLLSLILYNLAHNAIQATAPGKSVVLRVFRQLDNVVCEVQDEGHGLTESQRAALFQPCPSQKEGGSGIGLAISKQLAKSIGAEVELKESSNLGSVFVLRFPGCPDDVQSGVAAEKVTS